MALIDKLREMLTPAELKTLRQTKDGYLKMDTAIINLPAIIDPHGASAAIRWPSRSRPRLRHGRQPLPKTTLVRSTFDSCRTDRARLTAGKGKLRP
jgi:hypothetical protein